MARYDAMVSSEIVDLVRTEAGLDVGFWTAFKAWIAPLLVGDFGYSSVNGRPVLPGLLTAISYTVPLALSGLIIGLIIAVPLATCAARNQGGLIDQTIIVSENCIRLIGGMCMCDSDSLTF